MKKTFVTGLILVLLTSCYYGRNFYAPPLGIYNEDETPSTICVPVFINDNSDTQSHVSSTAGIIDMTPEGSPFGDYSEATSVMVTMPIMVGLNTVDNRDGNALSRIEANTYGFGFPLRFNREHSKINNDGAYIRYDIMSEQEGWENDEVGRIDYYYNAKNQTFSYRQVVALTIDPSDFAKNNGFIIPEPVYQTLVLIIQYEDVRIDGVEPNGMVSFSTVEFDNHGVIIPKVTIDQVNFGNLSFDSTDGENKLLYDPDVFTMSHYSSIIRSEDGTYITLNLPYTSEEYVDTTTYPSNMKSLISSVAGDDLRINDETEARKVNLDFAMAVLEELYQNPYQHDTYNSYGNFKTDILDKIKGLELVPASEFKHDRETNEYNASAMGPNPVIYDYERGIIATYQNNIGLSGGFYYTTDEAYASTNFSKFFGDLFFTDKSKRQDSIRKLIKDFLDLLGIDNEVYAENFYRMVKQSARIDVVGQYIWYTGVPVSAEQNPDEFETLLKEAYENLDPNSVQLEETWPSSAEF